MPSLYQHISSLCTLKRRCLQTMRIVSLITEPTAIDRILDRVLSAGARVAVLPCCHDLREVSGAELGGWLDGALAQDVARATRLRQAGYAVHTGRIPSDITPKKRLLLARPR